MSTPVSGPSQWIKFLAWTGLGTGLLVLLALLARFAPQPGATTAEPVRFALYNRHCAAPC